jgi:hypothetical protein
MNSFGDEKTLVTMEGHPVKRKESKESDEK